MHGGEGLHLLARVRLEEAHRVGELGDLVELHLRLHLLEARLELRELRSLVLPDAAGRPLEVRQLLPERQRGRNLPGVLLLESSGDVVQHRARVIGRLRVLELVERVDLEAPGRALVRGAVEEVAAGQRVLERLIRVRVRVRVRVRLG